MPHPSRLERAMELYLQCQDGELDPEQVLAGHDDLRDLLEMLLRPEPAAEEADSPRAIGDFELLRELGRGGMGVVHEARQRTLGRRVALKVLAADVSADPTRIARFRREASILARLEHPHIVRVFDAGENDGQHWLAMELVDGETFAQRLERQRRAGGHREGSLRQAVEIVAAVATALQHVHEQGLLHRDVKPSNVLLGADGRVLLSDFGLARGETAPELTRTGLLAGTPDYLAPEVLSSGTMTAASDIWSLGVMLYEAITLVRPFAGATDAAIWRQVAQQDPVDPRRRQPGLSKDLAAITLKALEKKPAERYATMAAFAADLRAFLDLRPTAARPLGPLRKLRRWLRREPLRASLAAAVLLLASLAAFLLVRLPLLRAGERAARAEVYEAAIAEGFVRRGDGQRELATRAAQRALALRPDAGEAMVVSALVKLRFENPTAALQELDRLTAAPHDDDDACQRLRALILGRLQRTAERDALLAQLGEPATQMGLLLAAGLLVEQQTPANIEAARRLISLATRLAPPRLLVHGQWATLAGPAERDECVAALQRLWPRHPFALHLAAKHVQWSDPSRAFELQREALRLGLQDPFGHYNLAAYADKSGHVPEAIAAAEVAMADPLLPEAQRPGVLQIFTDHAPEKVESALRTWQRLHPESALAERERGRALSLAGDHAQAIAVLRALHERAPGEAEVCFLLAWALQNGREWAASNDAVERLLELAPADRRAHQLRLRALDALAGEPAAVIAELRRRASAAPDDAEAWRELAERLLDAEQPEDRAEALRAAQRADACRDGQDRDALALLVRAHLALGESASAAEAEARLLALESAAEGR
ncbi:MAG: protein kinase [Planctomycetes bacterium]|nr:protein kinase [Planctomycetota bacterium]